MHVRMATADTPILQIAFLQDGEVRLAFMAEKSPLLSMSMLASGGVFSTFPKDEEVLKVVHKWCDEHQDPDRGIHQKLQIHNKKQITIMDSNSLVKSPTGVTYRFSEIEHSLKQPDPGVVAAATVAGDSFSTPGASRRRGISAASPTPSQLEARNTRQRGPSVLEKAAAEAQQRAEEEGLKKEARKAMKKMKKSENQRLRRDEKRKEKAAEKEAARAAERAKAEAAERARAEAAERAKAQAAERAQAQAAERVKAQAAETAKAQAKAAEKAKAPEKAQAHEKVEPPPVRLKTRP